MPDPNDNPEWKPPVGHTLEEIARKHLQQRGAGQEAEWRRQAEEFGDWYMRQDVSKCEVRIADLIFDFQRWLAEQETK